VNEYHKHKHLLLGHDDTSPLPCSRVLTLFHMQWSTKWPAPMDIEPLHAAELSTPQALVKLHQRKLQRWC
jgi:hypothetical protein